MEPDIKPLVLTHNDITYDGKTTFYYRDVEIGHRKSTIDNFTLLQKLIYKEFKIIITEIQITTTATYADKNGEYVRTSATPRGEIVTPSPEHGYNVCCRVKFANDTLGEWIHHRTSSSKDGGAVYCAQHVINDAINIPKFRASLCGIANEHKWIHKIKKLSLNLSHFNLSLQLTLSGRIK